MRFILPICFLLSVSLSAQHLDVYPVRVQHKTGFVKFYENFVDEVIPPKYDYIGDINLPYNTTQNTPVVSPYRAFETNRHIGIFDEHLNEVLPGQYQQIRPVAQNLFAVSKDSSFVLVDSSEAVLSGTYTFQDIRSAHHFFQADQRYVIVKQAEKYGLMGINGQLIIPPKYHKLLLSEIEGFFKVKMEPTSDWQIIDIDDKAYLRRTYPVIKVISSELAAIFHPHKRLWQLLPTIEGEETQAVPLPLKQQKFIAIEKVADGLLAVTWPGAGEEPPVVALWNLQTGQELNTEKTRRVLMDGLPVDLPKYVGYNGDFGMKIEAVNNRSVSRFLVTKTGRVLTMPFDDIFPTNKKGVFTFSSPGGGRRVGLYAPNLRPSPLLPPLQHEVLPFKYGIAVYRNGASYGLVVIRNERFKVINAIYDNVSVVDTNRVIVQLGDQTAYMNLTSLLELQGDLVMDDAWAISANASLKIQEAAPVNRKYQRWEPRYGDFLFHDIVLKKVGDTTAIYSEGRLAAKIRTNEPMKYLGEVAMGILDFEKIKTSVATSGVLSIFGYPIREHFFYDLENNRLLDKGEILGFYRLVHHQTVGTFIDKNGRFGLFREDGSIVPHFENPKNRLTWIGTFHNGYARACRGGRLVTDTEGDIVQPDRFKVDTKGNLMEAYQLKGDKKGFDKMINAPLYVVEEGDSKPVWGIIDSSGHFVTTPSFQYMGDVHHRMQVALTARPNKRERLGKPRADLGLVGTDGQPILPEDFSTIQILKGYIQMGVDSTPTIYFDQLGRQLFTNRTRIRDFACGRAAFKDDAGQWGYLDTLGNVVIPPGFQIARPFSEGLALVVTADDRCVFVDTAGNEVFDTELNRKQVRAVGDFHENLVWMLDRPTRRFGAWDKEGNPVIPPRFYATINAQFPNDQLHRLPMDFHQGVAIVKIKSGQYAQTTIVDTAGRQLMTPRNWHLIEPFQPNGLAIFQEKPDGLKGLIDKTGKVVLPPKYTNILPFENGYAPVKNRFNYWGMIDHLGAEVVPLKNNKVGVFSEGVIPVQSSSHLYWYYVAPQKGIVLKGPYKKAGAFNGGYALVTDKYDNTFAINTKGERIDFDGGKVLFFAEGIFGIKKPEGQYYYADGKNNNLFIRYFGEIAPFQKGTARIKLYHPDSKVVKRRPFAAINRRGVITVPPKYRNLHIQSDGNIIVNPQIFYGLASYSGKVLLEPIYDKIDFFKEVGIVRVEQGEQIGYVKIEDERVEWLWEMQW